MEYQDNVNIPIKCPTCNWPILPKGSVVSNGEQWYVLCPKCQTVIYLSSYDEVHHNLILREWNQGGKG